MAIGKAWRLGGFVTALVASGALVASATGATGAYFDDVHSGTVTGTIGSVTLSTSTNGGGGSEGLDFNFTNLMPGTPQTQKITYESTGSGPEDIWLVFPNAEALHSVNNMGTYGTVSVSSTNRGGLFSSINLNDELDANLVDDNHCGGNFNNSPGTSTTPPGCWPLPNKIKLASSLGSGQSGTMSFTFGLAAKWKDTSTAGHDPLCYPLIQDPTSTNPAEQVCSSTPSYGLPYQIVATQPGVQPDDPNNSVVTPK